MKITLGITTYKRPESLEKLLNQVWASDELNNLFNIVIVNDSGTEEDQLFYEEMLVRNNKNDTQTVMIYNNVKNIGLPLSFAKLVELVDTPYFLFMADDDLIIPNKIVELMDFIQRHSPSLLSARWVYKNDRIGRGIRETRKVKMSEFRVSSGHFSGIFFKTDQMKEVLPEFKRQVAIKNQAAITYPAVFFQIPLMLKYDNSWFYDADIVREGDGLASTVKDGSGNSYAALSSRIQQIAGFDSFILQFPNSEHRNEMLFESRAWAIAKALRSNKLLKQRIIELVQPNLLFRIKRKTLRIFFNNK